MDLGHQGDGFCNTYWSNYSENKGANNEMIRPVGMKCNTDAAISHACNSSLPDLVADLNSNRWTNIRLLDLSFCCFRFDPLEFYSSALFCYIILIKFVLFQSSHSQFYRNRRFSVFCNLDFDLIVKPLVVIVLGCSKAATY